MKELDRVDIAGHRATVRFVGGVEGVEGEWIGVEWDDPTRGRHDGAHKGRRYFQCRLSDSPTAASFVRLSKVTKTQSLASAIVSRYGDAADCSSDMRIRDGRSGHDISVTFVGADKVAEKQSQLARLVKVVCKGLVISRADDDEKAEEAESDEQAQCACCCDGTDECGQAQLAQLIPRVVELNIGDNLFSSWTSLHRVLRGLRDLRQLDVSGNIVAPLERPLRPCASFARLTHLFINKSRLRDWNQLSLITAAMPSLRQLHTCYNGLTHISCPLTLPHLELLNIEGNDISDSAQLQSLVSLSDLTQLILTGNGIASLSFPTDFPEITSLTLTRNQLSSWSDVNALCALPKLTRLRMSDNPILQSGRPEDIREEVIARVGTLTVLNGTTITERERRDSEMDYLARRYWEGSTMSEEERRKAHPRMDELVRAHGEPVGRGGGGGGVGGDGGESSALKGRLIPVVVRCAGTADRLKKLPRTLTVGRLRAMVQRLVNAKNGSGGIVMRVGQVVLDDDLRDLSFYSIEDNDILQVDIL